MLIEKQSRRLRQELFGIRGNAWIGGVSSNTSQTVKSIRRMPIFVKTKIGNRFRRHFETIPLLSEWVPCRESFAPSHSEIDAYRDT